VNFGGEMRFLNSEYLVLESETFSQDHNVLERLRQSKIITSSISH